MYRTIDLQPAYPDTITLSTIKSQKRQQDQLVQKLSARINYMRVKEQKALHKILIVNQKMKDLENHKTTKLERSEKNNKIHEEKAEGVKMLKQHLDSKRKIVQAKLKDKHKQVADETRHYKQDNRCQALSLRETHMHMNWQRVDHTKKTHYLLKTNKNKFKLQKKQEVENFKQLSEIEKNRIKQKRLQQLQELKKKQQFLVQKLKLSQIFRSKCEQEYQSVKQKYETSIRSVNDRYDQKPDIFIS